MASSHSDLLAANIDAAQVVVPCSDFNASLEFFVAQLGFRVDAISPADAPTTAVVSAYGVCLRLEARAGGSVPAVPLVLRVICDAPPQFDGPDGPAPDGIRIVWVTGKQEVFVPPAARQFVVSRLDDANAWVVGRAGMEYRDLIPGRLGGFVVASHIRIPVGGPVPDYVHFHRVRFQMIFCKAGWVRVVYEDQGPPFTMYAGDCVLQPPGIRHRVLEASPGLDVIEIACPAVHDTVADHAMALPTSERRTERLFGGQRFSRHIAEEARWVPWRVGGIDAAAFEACDVGIAAATSGFADVSVIRLKGATQAPAIVPLRHHGELMFLFVLEGSLTINAEEGAAGIATGGVRLRAGESAVIPPDAAYQIGAEAGLSLLKIML